MNRCVVNLITQASGVAALLFHVEHSGKLEWFYRWRIVGPYPPRYLEWRDLRCQCARAVIHPEIMACGVEAEWRAAEDEAWQPVSVVRALVGEAEFRIQAIKNFSAPLGFRAMAALSGDMVACYHLPPMEVPEGESIVVTGRADGPYPDNILLTPEEFHYEDALCAITNDSASRGFSEPQTESPALLKAIPGMEYRRVFARSASSRPQQPTPLQP